MVAKPLRREAEVRAEHLLTEMLSAQGWDGRKPPAGELLRQQEHRGHPELLRIFRGGSKTGKGGDALPEGVLLERDHGTPLAVIEVKASAGQLPEAEIDAKRHGDLCVKAGYRPLAIALAGASEDGFKVRVLQWSGQGWHPVTYDGEPIGWIPNKADAERLIAPGAPEEIRPSVPPADVLAARGDEINRLLRESGIKDEFRPAVVGAIMLALWKSKGNIRKDAQYILGGYQSSL